MSEKKWTPGPWCLAKDFMGSPVVTTEGLVKIATPSWLGECIGTIKGSEAQKEVMANAHLIAAVPDLYEALEAWEAHDDAISNRVIDPQEELRLLKRARDLTQAALRKADGV